MFYYFFGLPIITAWALFTPDKTKKPTERLKIDLKAPVVGYGITCPPKGMSMADWKKGKLRTDWEKANLGK